MARMRGPVLEPCTCFVRPPLTNATFGCLQAQLAPWFDQETLGVFCLLATNMLSTPWMVAASLTDSSRRQVGPGCLAVQPGLLRVLGPTDYCIGRLKKGALSGLSFFLRSLQRVRSIHVADLKPLHPLRVGLPSFPWADMMGGGRPQPAGRCRAPWYLGLLPQEWEWQPHTGLLACASLMVPTSSTLC